MKPAKQRWLALPGEHLDSGGDEGAGGGGPGAHPAMDQDDLVLGQWLQAGEDGAELAGVHRQGLRQQRGADAFGHEARDRDVVRGVNVRGVDGDLDASAAVDRIVEQPLWLIP